MPSSGLSRSRGFSGARLAVSDRKEDYHFKRWANEVKQRDHHTCQICGRRGVELNSHHMNSWNAFPEERYDVENGVSLCVFHHEDFHRKYGHGNNTRAQYEEYEQIASAMIRAAEFNCEVERKARQSCKLIEAHQEFAAQIIEDLDRKDGYEVGV